jgi:hypothetical protein
MELCTLVHVTLLVDFGKLMKRTGPKQHFVQAKMDSMNILLYPWHFVTHLKHVMEVVFRGLQWKTLFIYLDDIICFAKVSRNILAG